VNPERKNSSEKEVKGDCKKKILLDRERGGEHATKETKERQSTVIPEAKVEVEKDLTEKGVREREEIENVLGEKNGKPLTV